MPLHGKNQFPTQETPFYFNQYIKDMAYKVSDIVEYIIALVSEFASRFNLTDKQAYRYISFHKGISFLEENYGIIHTLDFDEAVDSVAMFCRRSGGEL